MKKMYDRTFGGYYVMSVILGLLLAVSVATMLEVAVLDAISAASGRMNAFWDDVWGYLPLNLCDWFWRPEIRTRNLNVLAVTTSVLTVGIFVRMSGTKGSRTKMLQAVATAILALLLMLAYGYATRGWIRNAALAVVPVLLMAVPLTILRKTQMQNAKSPLSQDDLDQLRGELKREGERRRLVWRIRNFLTEHWRETLVAGVLVLGLIGWLGHLGIQWILSQF